MHKQCILAALMMMIAAGPATQAGAASGVRTETMERLATERDPNLPYNLIGLLGLLGLVGLRRGHSEDSYHPSTLD